MKTKNGRGSHSCLPLQHNSEESLCVSVANKNYQFLLYFMFVHWNDVILMVHKSHNKYKFTEHGIHTPYTIWSFQFETNGRIPSKKNKMIRSLLFNTYLTQHLTGYQLMVTELWYFHSIVEPQYRILIIIAKYMHQYIRGTITTFHRPASPLTEHTDKTVLPIAAHDSQFTFTFTTKRNQVAGVIHNRNEAQSTIIS